MRILRTAADELKVLAQRADANGNHNDVLSNQEIRNAKLSAEATALLNRIAADAGNSTGGMALSNINEWIERYDDEFEILDLNANLHVSTAEMAEVDSLDRSHYLELAAYVATH